MQTLTIPTPTGDLTAIVDGDIVRAAAFADGPTVARLAGLPATPPPGPQDHDVAKRVLAWLDGDHQALAQVATDQPGTAFQHQVWAGMSAIPAGTTMTYAQLAAAVGRPSAARAVGSVCARNRLAPFVPCHRVLRGDGTLGGYAWGLEVKRWLLAHESAS